MGNRAWGFSEQDYVEAFARIVGRDKSVTAARKIFRDLEEHPENDIASSPELFAILSLLSSDAARRIQQLTGWSDQRLAAEQQKVERLRGADGS